MLSPLNHQSPLILLVDDDAPTRKMHSTRLQNDGYQVMEASNGREALESFARHPADVVLMDILMPEMDGLETCERLRQLPQGEQTPVLIISALSDPAAIDRAFEAGVSDYMLKPVNYSVLRNRLHYLMKTKQAQEALHKTNSLLKHILDHAPVFVYTLDEQGKLSFHGGGAPHHLGLPADESELGGSIFDYYRNRPTLINAVQGALRGKTNSQIVQHENDTLTLWHAPLYDIHDEVGGVMGVGVSLNAGDWQDHAYLELQRVMQTFLGNVHGALYRSRRNGKDWWLEYISEGCHELTGYYPADLIGNRKVSLQDLIHPEDRQEMETAVEISRQTGKRYQMTFRLRRADGQERWVWEQAMVVPNPKTHSEDVVVEGFITDISDLKETQERLLNERGLLRTLIDNLPDYIFVKNMAGEFVVSNIANAHYLGVRHPQEVIGKTDYDFHAPERANLFRKDDISITTTLQPMLHHEIQVASETGQRWYDITKVPLIDADDQVSGLVGMIREISAQKEAQQQLILANQQLEELSQLKSHFLLTMSHELRTPLNVILVSTDLLLQGLLGELNEKQQDRLQRVYQSGKNLLNMIEDVLDISKIQTGQMEIHLEAIDFPSILAQELPQYIQQAEAKGLMVQQDIEAHLPPIYGDGGAILKILTNLMSNAVKFTHTGSIFLGAQPIPPDVAQTLPISISDSQQTWVLLSIQDTGIGMSAETMQRIFDEFRQADNSSTRQHGGIGLGLALCHKLVGLMNGHIWLDSTVGYGSTFFVMLPAILPKAPKPAK